MCGEREREREKERKRERKTNPPVLLTPPHSASTTLNSLHVLHSPKSQQEPASGRPSPILGHTADKSTGLDEDDGYDGMMYLALER